MLTPALLYLTGTILVSDSPASVESWKQHFYARRRAFFCLVFVTLLSSPLRTFTVLGSIPSTAGAGITPFTALVLFLIAAIGAFTSVERIHRRLVLIATGTVLIAYAIR